MFMLSTTKKEQVFYTSLQATLAKTESFEAQQNAILTFLYEKNCFPADFNFKEHMQDTQKAKHIRYHIAKKIIRQILTNFLNATQGDAKSLEICREAATNYVECEVMYRLDNYKVNDPDEGDFDDNDRPYDFTRPRVDTF